MLGTIYATSYRSLHANRYRVSAFISLKHVGENGETEVWANGDLYDRFWA